MNLLIVDDIPTELKLLRAQLEAEGHAVFEAHDGVDALALLERQRVDVVISDILMPRMDGYRLCHEIRASAGPPLHDLPIILYTATYTSPSDEKLALDVGADKYLKKPASVETLVAALHEVIAKPHAGPRPEALQEIEVLKEYSERLVSKLAEKNSELIASEVKFRSLVEQSIVGIYIIQDDQYVYVNPKMAEIFGLSEEEMISRTFYDFLVPEDHALARENIRKRISGEVQNIHYYLRVLHQSGAVLQVEIHGSQMDYNGRPAVMGTLMDITERKAAEARIRRLNRVYAVLSSIDSLIVRARDRDELFREACRIAVEAGAFKMAWIGVIDPQTLDGKVVAWSGGEEGYIDIVRLTARDGTPHSERPACRALRQLQPVICNDIATDPSVAPLRDDLLRRGHKSVGCFPLTVTGRPDAVIALLAGELDFFDDEETRLLLELAGNISFALDHIEKEKKLNYLAYYDVLTGLANRTLFLERVAQYIRSAVSGGHKLALFMIDLERFKNINDSLGRPAGDALLRQVAEWLTRNAADKNLLARVGADHFAAVLPVVKQEGDVAR
ncbi:MAG: PAS domain S-box protein, partial [Actinomycetota bacterium]